MRPVRRPQFNTKIEEIEDEEDSDFDRISSTASTDSGKFIKHPNCCFSSKVVDLVIIYNIPLKLHGLFVTLM